MPIEVRPSIFQKSMNMITRLKIRFVCIASAIFIIASSTVLAGFQDFEQVKLEKNDEGRTLEQIIFPFDVYRTGEIAVDQPLYRVEIRGVVKRPGLYYLNKSSARAALEMSGLISAQDHKVISGIRRVLIIRANYGGVQKIHINLSPIGKADAELAELAEFELETGDIIIVPGLLF